MNDGYNIIPNYKWFSLRELENGQMIPIGLYPNIISTAMILDILREKIQEPIYVNSTYRDPLYNQAVGGAKDSMHLYFNAIDFTIKRVNAVSKMMAMKALYSQLKAFDAKGYIYSGHGAELKKNIMGLGLYLRGTKSFIHIDTRGLLGKPAPARWYG